MATKGRKDSYTRKRVPMQSPSEIGRSILELVARTRRRKGKNPTISERDLAITREIESRRNGNGPKK